MEIVVAVVMAVIIAFIVCAVLVRQMKSVAEKQDARDYMKGKLVLTQRRDMYTHTTQTRVKIQNNNNNNHRP